MTFEGWPVSRLAPWWIRLALLFVGERRFTEGAAFVRYKELSGIKYIIGVKWALWA